MANTYKDFFHLVSLCQTNTVNKSTCKAKGFVITATKLGNDPNSKINNVVDDKFTSHIQTAYDMGVPALIFYTWYPDSMRGWMSDPAPKDEWNMQVITWLMKGHENAGIILDMRNYEFESGGQFTPNEYAARFWWLANVVKKAYPDKKVYPLLASRKDAFGDVITNNLFDVDTNGIIAQNANSIVADSVISDVTRHYGPADVSISKVPLLGTNTWENLFFPGDAWKPNYDPYNVPKMLLSYYAAGKTLPGIDGTTDIWQYAGPFATFCSENGYIPPTTEVTPVDPPTSGSTIPTGDTGDTSSAAEVAELQGIRTILQAILDLIKGFFSKFS